MVAAPDAAPEAIGNSAMAGDALAADLDAACAAADGVAFRRSRSESEPGTLRARDIAAISFAITCSGPFGVESCLRTFGAAWSMAGFALAFLAFVIPQILMTAELSMILPLSNGGVIAWVDRAFGKVVAAVAAINMMVYQLVDLATYPTLVAGYAQDLGYSLPGWSAACSSYVVIALGFLVNLTTIEVATQGYLWALALILAPFAVGLALSAGAWPTAWAVVDGRLPATSAPPPPASLNLFLSTMLWLNTGWDSIGNLAVEVESPRSLVRGLATAAFACPVVYSASTFGALAAGAAQPWDDGYLATAYGRLWPPLTPWIVAMSGLSNFSLYASALACVARLIQAMGDEQQGCHLLPKCFAYRAKNKAPLAALLFVTALEVALVAGLSFEYLIRLSTLVHVLVFWCLLAAYAHFKFRRADAERKWTLPGGPAAAAAVVLVQVPVLAALCISAFTDMNVVWGAIIGNVVFLIALTAWACYRGQFSLSAMDAMAPLL